MLDAAQMYEESYDSDRYTIPECIMIWGNNPIVSNPDGFMGHWIVDLMKRGTKLIVVDPRVTWLAAKAEHHLQLRPGTDAALALGMLNVIINEGLYDKAFVDRWTHGFEELRERVQDYPPHKVAEITWVPEELIIAAARSYANSKPAGLQWGLAMDMAPGGIAAAHAVSCLWTVTGNVDIPGGNILVGPAYDAPIADAASDWGLGDLPEELRAKRLGSEYPLYRMGFAPTSQGDAVLKACETGKPYPIKMLWLQSTNPIANMGADAKRVYAAMKNVPFIVVADLFMTPTAVACADLILPAASSPERDSLRAWWRPLRSLSKVVTISDEIKSDEEIVLDLGKRLNPKEFPWTDVKDLLTWCIRNSGMTFEELEQSVYTYPEWNYRKYEKGLLRPDGQPGFNTATGKVELYLSLFDAWGLGMDSLPYYTEPTESPVSTPELLKEYPLVLTTGARSWVFFHSENRQQASAREIHPNPVTQINPETARMHGIRNGDWIWIENSHGRCRQKAEVTPIIPAGIVHSEHGWWFPEKPAAAPSLFGVWDSNINLLTTQCDNGPSGYGAPYKTQICKIYKAEEGA